MSRFRKGNSFPDLNTPGDPRTLAAIERRTPNIAGGGVNHVHGGIILTPGKPKVKTQLLPFQVSATLTRLAARYGVVGSTEITDSALLEVTNPADGTWYFVAKVEINATTGALVSESAGWAFDAMPDNTTTDF